MAPVRETAEAVIIGGGLAGAATAFFLAQSGMRDVVVVEKEERPGLHASGRNAAMVRRIVTGPDLLAPVVEGARFIESEARALPTAPAYAASGALILARGASARALRGEMRAYGRAGIDAAWVDAGEVERRVAFTQGGGFDGGVLCARDGVVDVAALLEGYLRAAVRAGVRLRLCARAELRHEAARRRWVVTAGGAIETPTVVNAAGAWAGEIARRAGASDLPLRPCRRHLVASAPIEGVDPRWPYVWDVSHGLYFRPESGGLLLSACDETVTAADACVVDPSVAELLAQKVERFMPRLADLSVRRMWAGLRTLTPDGNFVIGPDPKAEGFIWCAGLGGHGVTASAAVGRMAADAVAGRATPAAHAPARFQRHGNQ